MTQAEFYRDPDVVARLAEAVRRVVTRPWTIMEVCGGQTHSIVRHALDSLLPDAIEILHGPGCPVCVTPLEMLDRALAIAALKNTIFCSFGDMLRVPGSRGDLLSSKARGADVRVVYSPLDAVEIARKNPSRDVVFFAVGFETTAPANAMAVKVAHRERLLNFSVLVSHVLVPPAITSILQTADNRVQGFLGPGHVCTVMGTSQYESICRRYRVPIAITGFEPGDLMGGILATVAQLERGEARVETTYARAVQAEGNPAARALVEEVFDVCDRKWRGIGRLPKSGLKLRFEYAAHDAEKRFDVQGVEAEESAACISGKVLRGLAKPAECPAFGRECTPSTPLGATMVSAEGACSAYFQFRRHGELRA